MLRIVVIGNGRMGLDTLRTVEATPEAAVALCLADAAREGDGASLAIHCANQGIPFHRLDSLGSPEALARLIAAAPDYIISADNFFIFKAELLAVPRLGIVNFHNGPLPRYGGLHACSWAILNGESTHGVTWHRVDAGIDTGPIVAQERFPLHGTETAIGLISDCIERGGALLRRFIPALVAGRIHPQPQPREERLYHGRKDIPWAGALPWNASRATLERLARALDFHPLPNQFFRPRLAARSERPFWIESFVVHGPLPAPTTAAGRVLEVRDDTILLAATDCVLELRDPCDESANLLDAPRLETGYGVRPGRSLVDLTVSRDPDVPWHRRA